MGRGDNRRTQKMRQRKNQEKKKAARKRALAEGQKKS